MLSWRLNQEWRRIGADTVYAVKEYSIIIILDVHTYTFLRFFKNLNVSKKTVWPLFWDILVKAIENHAQKRLNNISKMLKFV